MCEVSLRPLNLQDWGEDWEEDIQEDYEVPVVMPPPVEAPKRRWGKEQKTRDESR